MAGVLSRLPGVWVGKETGFIAHLYGPGVDQIHEWDDRRLAAFLQRVNSYLRVGRWSSLASAAGARRFWSATGSTGYGGLIRYVWSLDQAPDGRQAVWNGDQTPTYVLALPLLERLFPNAHYVHVVRDSRDVVASVLPLPFWSKSAVVAASDWNDCIAGWWAAERRIPAERRCEVRYEDLVTDPVGTLQRLASFVGSADPVVDDRLGGAIDAHGLASIVSHHQRLGEPIDAGSIGRHRRDLSARDRELVEAITYAGLVTYGYSVGPFRPSPVLEENAALLTRARLVDLRRRALGAVVRRWPG
jgi:hypothetical protein